MCLIYILLFLTKKKNRSNNNIVFVAQVKKKQSGYNVYILYCFLWIKCVLFEKLLVTIDDDKGSDQSVATASSAKHVFTALYQSRTAMCMNL